MAENFDEIWLEVATTETMSNLPGWSYAGIGRVNTTTAMSYDEIQEQSPSTTTFALTDPAAQIFDWIQSNSYFDGFSEPLPVPGVNGSLLNAVAYLIDKGEREGTFPGLAVFENAESESASLSEVPKLDNLSTETAQLLDPDETFLWTVSLGDLNPAVLVALRELIRAKFPDCPRVQLVTADYLAQLQATKDLASWRVRFTALKEYAEKTVSNGDLMDAARKLLEFTVPHDDGAYRETYRYVWSKMAEIRRAEGREEDAAKFESRLRDLDPGN